MKTLTYQKAGVVSKDLLTRSGQGCAFGRTAKRLGLDGEDEGPDRSHGEQGF